MEIHIILNRTDLFDDYCEWLSEDEIIYTRNIKIEDIEMKEEIIGYLTKITKKRICRNAFEEIQNEGKQFFNMIILDYPFNEDYQKDSAIIRLINDVAQYLQQYNVIEKTDEEVIDEYLPDDTSIMKISVMGSPISKEKRNELITYINQTGLNNGLIIEQNYEFNAGASGGHYEVLLQFIGTISDFIGIKGYIEEKFPYIFRCDYVDVADIRKLKRKISDIYEIHEDSLELKLMDKDNLNNDNIKVVFKSKNARFEIQCDESFNIIKIERNDCNNQDYREF